MRIRRERYESWMMKEIIISYIYTIYIWWHLMTMTSAIYILLFFRPMRLYFNMACGGLVPFVNRMPGIPHSTSSRKRKIVRSRNELIFNLLPMMGFRSFFLFLCFSSLFLFPFSSLFVSSSLCLAVVSYRNQPLPLLDGFSRWKDSPTEPCVLGGYPLPYDGLNSIHESGMIRRNGGIVLHTDRWAFI